MHEIPLSNLLVALEEVYDASARDHDVDTLCKMLGVDPELGKSSPAKHPSQSHARQRGSQRSVVESQSREIVGGRRNNTTPSSSTLSWSGALQTLLQFSAKRREEKQKTLREVLQSKFLQRLILILVILDLVIVAVSVQFPTVRLLATLNAVADRGLLVIFVLEAVALMYVASTFH